MACEPCIRGHRSTKCTHANERLMVPVRKPGRPLSACPHPRDQPCNCGSVTAAIPRKQACHCGPDTPVSAPSASVQRANSMSDSTSPTQLTFKVQKIASKPLPGRRPSLGPVNLDRIDPNQVNIIPQHPHRMQIIPQNAYHIPTSQPFGFGPPHYPLMQPQYGNIPMQPPPPMHSLGGSISDTRINGYAHGHSSLNQVLERPLETPTEVKNGQDDPSINGSSCALSAPESSAPVDDAVTNGGPSGTAQQNTHGHTSSITSTVSEPLQPTPQPKSCCSSNNEPARIQNSQMNTPSINPHVAQDGFPMNNAMYSQYLPTVFTYPPTYGSYQNPLQPSAWRQGVRDMSYGHVQGQPPISPAPLPFGSNPQLAQNLDTVHTCGCGDGCQCVGCAAHPYNDATRQYVYSAWESMKLESDMYNNGHLNGRISGDGNTAPISLQTQDVIKENPTSPPPATPSSTTSGVAEEQSLSASDFFFVNYPFAPGVGCGGDTQSCPCGDDCQCLGCTIHRTPEIPCPGEKDNCPCADDCACVGCTIHNM
ncbi:hypothetical protein EYC80_010668 [Monilinia laxa]|uniref:Copper-fist domain-containing protein n=1 Tax=Monilinia laxa TaxID=61186 RepID=A0A5N6JQB7_MONLA|nr:hypothetical protein EYC80_010668 [Monilinia laxa]